MLGAAKLLILRLGNPAFLSTARAVEIGGCKNELNTFSRDRKLVVLTSQIDDRTDKSFAEGTGVADVAHWVKATSAREHSLTVRVTHSRRGAARPLAF